MQLKITSLNVWIGGTLFDNLLAFLKQEQADILLLQEVFTNKNMTVSRQYRTFEALQEELKYPYAHFAPAFIEEIDGKDIVQGNAIFSKFPLREISITTYGIPYGRRINERPYYHLSPRNLQHVVVKVENRDLHLLNTQGIWGEEGYDTSSRLAMSASILREVDNHTPLILAGDFNVRPDTQTIRMIEKKLKSVFKDELKTSFNLNRKNLEKHPGYAEAVVDMMFITPDIKIIEHQSPQVDVSDHLPLQAIAEIK